MVAAAQENCFNETSGVISDLFTVFDSRDDAAKVAHVRGVAAEMAHICQVRAHARGVALCAARTAALGDFSVACALLVLCGRSAGASRRAPCGVLPGGAGTGLFDIGRKRLCSGEIAPRGLPFAYQRREAARQEDGAQIRNARGHARGSGAAAGALAVGLGRPFHTDLELSGCVCVPRRACVRRLWGPGRLALPRTLARAALC